MLALCMMIHVIFPAIRLRSKHIPRHALRLRTRITDGGIVDDPSVSASYRLKNNATQTPINHDLQYKNSKETQKKDG